jgi:uncharacterized protein DUF4242
MGGGALADAGRCSYRGDTVQSRAASISQGFTMSRYLVERTFPDGLSIPQTDAGARLTRQVVAHNAMDGVTWVHSYVSLDKTKTYCVYDGPSPEAIRTVAERNKLPVDRIMEVSVLDPYFYRA